MMKVLLACEESQVACKAFRKRGHEAYSCDLQECSGFNGPDWNKRPDHVLAKLLESMKVKAQPKK